MYTREQSRVLNILLVISIFFWILYVIFAWISLRSSDNPTSAPTSGSRKRATFRFSFSDGGTIRHLSFGFWILCMACIVIVIFNALRWKEDSVNWQDRVVIISCLVSWILSIAFKIKSNIFYTDSILALVSLLNAAQICFAEQDVPDQWSYGVSMGIVGLCQIVIVLLKGTSLYSAITMAGLTFLNTFELLTQCS